MITTQGSVVETRTARIWLEDNEILRTVIYPKSELTFEDARDILDRHIELVGDNRVVSLVDIRQIKSVTREARTHATDESVSRFALALALIVDTPVSRVIGNFFLGINRPPYPTRLFTSEREAVNWLKGFIG